jgi:hypothetical protein
MQNNPYRPPEHSVAAAGDIAPATGQPIGGWLILVLIGLVISLVRAVAMWMTDYGPMLREGAWTPLTTPGTPVYHVLWGPFIAIEFGGSAISVVLGLATLVCFLRRSRRTPTLAICLYGLTAVINGVDLYAGNFIPAVAAHADPASTKTAIRTLIGAAIWIPYFLISQRVKATFVR